MGRCAVRLGFIVAGGLLSWRELPSLIMAAFRIGPHRPQTSKVIGE